MFKHYYAEYSGADDLCTAIRLKMYDDIPEILNSYPASINARSNVFKQKTALHIAAECGDVETIKILVQKGANVNIDSSEGTPLHIAAGYGNTEAVRTLITNGASISVKDSAGMTALHHAARHRYIEIMRILISSGADVNSKTNAGATPLHIAAERKEIESVKLLLQNGADANAKNRRGETPDALSKIVSQCFSELGYSKKLAITLQGEGEKYRMAYMPEGVTETDLNEVCDKGNKELEPYRDMRFSNSSSSSMQTPIVNQPPEGWLSKNTNCQEEIMEVDSHVKMKK